MIRGSAAVSRALPSFSVIEIIPVSATAKLAPVIPTSACTYFCRRTRRARRVNSSGLSEGTSPSVRWNVSRISPRVRCIAGKTMW